MSNTNQSKTKDAVAGVEIEPDLKKGDQVFVRNYTMSGKEIIEGKATVLKRVGQDRFKVHFDGDERGNNVTRFVVPEHRQKGNLP